MHTGTFVNQGPAPVRELSNGTSSYVRTLGKSFSQACDAVYAPRPCAGEPRTRFGECCLCSAPRKSAAVSSLATLYSLAVALLWRCPPVPKDHPLLTIFSSAVKSFGQAVWLLTLAFASSSSAFKDSRGDKDTSSIALVRPSSTGLPLLFWACRLGVFSGLLRSRNGIVITESTARLALETLSMSSGRNAYLSGNISPLPLD